MTRLPSYMPSEGGKGSGGKDFIIDSGSFLNNLISNAGSAMIVNSGIVADPDRFLKEMNSPDPRKDQYSPDRNRADYSIYNSEYFSASNVKIFMGGIWIDDATSVNYTLAEKILPVYGYASYTYDDVARGSRIVQGGFSINFKSSQYMRNVLLYADAIMFQLKLAKHTNRVKPFHFKSMKLHEILTMIGKTSFQEIVEEYENAIWGDDQKLKGIASLVSEMLPHFNQDRVGFDLRIEYGAVEEVIGRERYRASGQKDYLKDAYGLEPQDKKAPITAEIINGIQIHTTGKEIATANSSLPIQEVYQFIARDINGTSREELMALLNMEFEDHLIPVKDANKTSDEKIKNEKKKASQIDTTQKKKEEDIKNASLAIKPGQDVKSQFVRAIDGDTLEFIMDYNEKLGAGSEKVVVRLLGVDTPELSSNEMLAKEAEQFVRSIMVDAKSITLEYEQDNIMDKHGRVLAYVYADGKMLQESLLEAGFAKYAYSDLQPNGEYKHSTKLKDAEKRARSTIRYDANDNSKEVMGINLWSYPNAEHGKGLTQKDINEFKDFNKTIGK